MDHFAKSLQTLAAEPRFNYRHRYLVLSGLILPIRHNQPDVVEEESRLYLQKVAFDGSTIERD